MQRSNQRGTDNAKKGYRIGNWNCPEQQPNAQLPNSYAPLSAARPSIQWAGGIRQFISLDWSPLTTRTSARVSWILFPKAQGSKYKYTLCIKFKMHFVLGFLIWRMVYHITEYIQAPINIHCINLKKSLLKHLC